MSESLSPTAVHPDSSIFKALLYQEWKNCRESIASLAVLWVIGLWVLLIFHHPAWLLAIGLIYVLMITGSQAGRDVMDGTEEFSFTLPPGRGPLFLARLTPGFLFLAANGVLGSATIAFDLPQRLWSIVFSSGLTQPFSKVEEPLWYAMALLVPVAAHSITFSTAALIGTRAGVSLSWLAGFVGAGAIVLAGNYAENHLWQSSSGLLTSPALLAVTVLAPFVGYQTYLRKEAAGVGGVTGGGKNVKALLIIAAVVAGILVLLMLPAWMNSIAKRNAAARESRPRVIQVEEHVRRHPVKLGTDAEED